MRIGWKMVPELFADLGDYLANAFAGISLQELRPQQLFFGIPELKADAFMNSGIAPNGEHARFFRQIDQDAIPLFGIKHTEQLKYFGCPFHRMVAVAEIFNKKANFSTCPLFGSVYRLHNAGFFLFCEKHI